MNALEATRMFWGYVGKASTAIAEAVSRHLPAKELPDQDDTKESRDGFYDQAPPEHSSLVDTVFTHRRH